MNRLNSKFKMLNSGFSTVEILIAFALLIIALSGILIVVFGNDSFAIDSQLNSEALFFAEQELNRARAEAAANFASYFGASGSEDGGRYGTDVEVQGLSPCSSLLTSNVSWSPTPLRENNVSLQTVVSSLDELFKVGGDCDALPKIGGFDSPEFYDNQEIIHPGSQATGVDIIENDAGTYSLLTTQGSGDQLWIVEVSDPDNPVLVESLDFGNHLYAIDAYSEDTVAYAYIATASSTAQLLAVQIDFSGGGAVLTTKTFQLPGVSGSEPEGRDVFFYDGRVYIGTRRTAGEEFHVFDASSPLNLSHLGSVELNHSITDIAVQGSYAYLSSTATTDAGCEMIIVNISNPASMTNTCNPASTSGVMNFRAPGNESGTAIEVLGGTAYLGRESAGGNHDFYVLNVSDVNNVTSRGSIDLDLNPNTEVVEVIVRGTLAFLATSDQTPANGAGPFLVYNISDPEDGIEDVLACNLNYAEKSVAMDYHDDIIYIADESNLALRILFQSASCS